MEVVKVILIIISYIFAFALGFCIAALLASAANTPTYIGVADIKNQDKETNGITSTEAKEVTDDTEVQDASEW